MDILSLDGNIVFDNIFFSLSIYDILFIWHTFDITNKMILVAFYDLLI